MSAGEKTVFSRKITVGRFKDNIRQQEENFLYSLGNLDSENLTGAMPHRNMLEGS